MFATICNSYSHSLPPNKDEIVGEKRFENNWLEELSKRVVTAQAESEYPRTVCVDYDIRLIFFLVRSEIISKSNGSVVTNVSVHRVFWHRLFQLSIFHQRHLFLVLYSD